uniref:Uncharacterized protein n=1 Tax=Heterorhabditis bacteriophora TaxID=37862 RepID=A0A1I7XAX4_HETBA
MLKKRRGLPMSSQDMHDVPFAMRRGGSGIDFRTNGQGDRNVTVAALLGKECAEDIIDVSHSSQFLQYTIAGMLTKPLSSVTARSVQMKKSTTINGVKVDTSNEDISSSKTQSRSCRLLSP